MPRSHGSDTTGRSGLDADDRCTRLEDDLRLGIYATAASVFDLVLLLALGILGFVMRRYDYPLAPLMIGMVLGPLAERSLRDALLSSVGDPSILVHSGITWAIYGLLALVVGVSLWNSVRTRTRKDV